ncbi:MAG: histidinol-phosphatase [Lentisphaeria bacterium]|nr:histidinol-phosphatase [Lentisphaeria bacterium]
MLKNSQVNLHTHTVLCNHAAGTVRDYCRQAVKDGLKVLGFSEHSTFPDDRMLSTRMKYAMLESYRQEIEDAKSEFPELTILAGLEVDYDSDFPLEFYQKELKERLDLDFMSAGAHFVNRDTPGKYYYASHTMLFPPEIIRMFTEKTSFLIKSGLFDFITHPDMIAVSIDKWTPEIADLFAGLLQTAEKHNVPLEINAYGLRKPQREYADGIRPPYPYAPFWKLASGYNISALVSSDAHKPEDVVGNLPDAFDFAEEYGITCCNAAVAEKIIAKNK